MFVEIHYEDGNELKPQMLNVNRITEVIKTPQGHAKIYFGQQNDWIVAEEAYEWVKAHLPKAVPFVGSREARQKLEDKRYPRGNE